ncbi:MAG: hypothetical protein SV775_19235 [Thermodesulfobacteriota bacterium]|nr:hypothetical protein [Thermodesulfobacteriota bacterium]
MSPISVWNSTYADSCEIDQGIGSVPVKGSLRVTPTETTTYSITATGPGGEATDGVTIIISPITISITSPLDSATITRPDVMVQGTISNSAGNETGVVINGVIALVYGNKFVANHVPLGEGENTITATDTAGNTTTTSIAIDGATQGDYIRITADTESGVSPLETTLAVDGSFGFTASSFSYAGPDAVEFLSVSAEEYDICKWS